MSQGNSGLGGTARDGSAGITTPGNSGVVEALHYQECPAWLRPSVRACELAAA